MYARAFCGLGEYLAVLIYVLDGVALVLGALSDEHRAILEWYGHSVMCRCSLYGIDRLGIVFAYVLGLVNLGYAVAIGKQCGKAVVVHYMAGVRCVYRGVSKRGFRGVVVVVIPVGLGDASGVEGKEAIPLGDHDVAAITGIIQAKEGIHLLLAEGLSGLGIIRR